MKTLALEYDKNGYHHRQIYREGDMAIYETTTPESGRVVCYEVFEVQKNASRVMPGGRILEESESTPSNEGFGLHGWAVANLEDAHEKVRILKARVESRNLRNGNRLQSISNGFSNLS